MSSINDRLAALHRIQGLASHDSKLEKLLASEDNDKASALISERMETISALVQGVEGTGGNSLWIEPKSPLTKEQYILPPELVKVHEQVLKDLASKSEIENLTYAGVLLMGELPGTGKTEYSRFLASEVGENVRFVVAEIDQITKSENPGSVLKKLYRALDKKAQEENVWYVVVLDEFERIVNKHAKLHSSSKSEHTNNNSARSSVSTEKRESTETMELSDSGNETFATFKELTGGSSSVSHVYTIATSNQTAFDPALVRRLNGVELQAIPLIESRNNREAVLDYFSYHTLIPTVMKVLQTAYVRDRNEGSEFLSQIESELDEILRETEKKYKPNKPSIKSKGERWFEEMKITEAQEASIKAQEAVRSNEMLKGLMRYFSIEINQEREEMSHKEKNKIEFGGIYKEPIVTKHSEQIPFKNFLIGEKRTLEHQAVTDLTPSKIAKWYKEDKQVFDTYDTTKQKIGELLFPQLAIIRSYSKVK